MVSLPRGLQNNPVKLAEKNRGPVPQLNVQEWMIFSFPCEVNQSSKKTLVYVNLVNEALLLFFVQGREERNGSTLATDDRWNLTEALGKDEDREFQVTKAQDEFVQFALLALTELIRTIINEKQARAFFPFVLHLLIVCFHSGHDLLYGIIIGIFEEVTVLLYLTDEFRKFVVLGRRGADHVDLLESLAKAVLFMGQIQHVQNDRRFSTTDASATHP